MILFETNVNCDIIYTKNDILNQLFQMKKEIEITSWLVSANDFYSRVVKDR